jgi:signal transduction histidine kinase
VTTFVRRRLAAWSAWTTRQHLRAGVATALTLLVLLGAVGGWALFRSTQISDRLVNHSSPALVSAVRLEAALLDQETGIRGYGLTGQTSFLAPYTTGLADERSALANLRTTIDGDVKAGRELNTVLAAAQLWQQRIADPIATAPPGAPVALAIERADEGKTEFDRFRALAANQQADLQTDRRAAAWQLNEFFVLRDWIFAVIALLIVLLTVACFAALRYGITTPLERLAADAGRVSDGDFEHPIAATGPGDLHALAERIEAMRRRLVTELSFAGEARTRLAGQAVELRRSNAELEQFAYVASHDLQEPLRKVASFCQLLQRRYAGRLDGRADQYIAIAVDGATRMQTLINDLLSFSRIGRMNSERTEVDLEHVLTGVIDSLSLAVEESGAQITHDPLPHVTGDETLLGMLLQNLLNNAVKFRSPQRTPQIHLGARRDDELWRLVVTDNGIGIDPAYTERVFTIFQRLHTRDAYPGTGIGLALCRKIVEYHGGSIDVDPHYTGGARIVFTLPVRAPQQHTYSAGPEGAA